MSQAEQSPLRALSESLDNWSEQNSAFLNSLQDRLRGANQRLQEIEAAAVAAPETPPAPRAKMGEDVLANRLATLQSENQELREQLSQTASGQAAMKQQCEDLRAQIADTETLRKRAADLETELKRTRANIAALEAQLEEASRQNEVLASTSEKSSAPVESLPDGLPCSVPEIPAFDETGKKKKTGEILVAEGILTPQQLQRMLVEQAGSPHVRLGSLAIQHGYTNEDLIAKVLAAQLRLPYVDLQIVEIEPEALELLSSHLARLHRCIPLRHAGERVMVAMSNPLDLIAIEDIELATRRRIQPIVASAAAITTALERYYPLPR